MRTGNLMGYMKFALLLTTVSCLVACSAISRISRSDNAVEQDPLAMSQEGQRRVERGTRLLDRGQARLAEGQTLVREGQIQIEESNRVVAQSLLDYQRAARETGDATTPRQANREIRRLREIGDQWEQALEDLRDGNRMVERGNDAIARAQNEIQEGRELSESGSLLLRNSERLRLGEPLLPTPSAEADSSEL